MYKIEGILFYFFFFVSSLYILFIFIMKLTLSAVFLFVTLAGFVHAAPHKTEPEGEICILSYYPW